jgi:glyoxylate utilization-related uncharacterized protein
MYHHFFVCGFNPKVEVEVWDIGPDEDEIIFVIAGNMLANVTGTVRTINEYQFIFGVKMPEEKVAQVRVYKESKGTTGTGCDLF